jgi:hypothetical protein
MPAARRRASEALYGANRAERAGSRSTALAAGTGALGQAADAAAAPVSSLKAHRGSRQRSRAQCTITGDVITAAAKLVGQLLQKTIAQTDRNRRRKFLQPFIRTAQPSLGGCAESLGSLSNSDHFSTNGTRGSVIERPCFTPSRLATKRFVSLF